MWVIHDVCDVSVCDMCVCVCLCDHDMSVYLCHVCVICVRPVMCVCLCVGGYSGFVTRDVCAVGCTCQCVICVFTGDVCVCDGCLYVMFVSVCICVMCLYVQCCPVHVVSVRCVSVCGEMLCVGNTRRV